MLVFCTSLVAVFLSAFIQNSNFAILGVKPNLVLVVILAFGLLEKDWLKRAILVLLAIATLIIEPGLGLKTILIMSIFFLALALIDFLPWREIANSASALVIGTLLIDVGGFQFNVFLMEALYNLSLLGILVLIFTLSWVKYSK